MTSKTTDASRNAGYRSGLEVAIAKQLEALGYSFTYEQDCIEYMQPAKKRTYTPDFRLVVNGIIIEGKGRFETADRQKHLLIKAQHPELDIRFVFSNSNAKISKDSKTSYADWCNKHGFLFADKRIPQGWLDEVK